MLEFDDSSSPLAPGEMVHVTRENGRNLNHYQDILEQNKLPRLTPAPGTTFLEIGTGLGNAIPGILSLTGGRGRVVSIDINHSTSTQAADRLREFFARGPQLQSLTVDMGGSPPDAKVEISFFSGELPDPIPPGVTLIQADISDDFTLPCAAFDRALSIWVFYQILDKLRAAKNVLQSLKPGGEFSAVSTGSVAFTNEKLSGETKAWLRERVWNTRASRFSWLTGTRELAHWAGARGVGVRVLSLADAMQLLFPDLNLQLGETQPGRPEGAFVATIPQDREGGLAHAEFDLPEGSFVSTRSSSVVPVYYAPEIYESLLSHEG